MKVAWARVSPVARILLIILLAVIALAASALLYQFNEINNYIDRCGDNSSPKYIADDVTRSKLCKN
jgi:hypothetical protein